MLANGRKSLQTPEFNPVPVVMLFTPAAGASWLLHEKLRHVLCLTHPRKPGARRSGRSRRLGD
ncbi:DUF2958 domain-containing protein [Luteibacter sahnii]|nr:DUF2958 domain-containing protein [Luteibacter sp. PPL193]